MKSKPIASLQINDLEAHAVWRYTNINEDETSLVPVEKLPVTTLLGRVVATQITLANGLREWALLRNIETSNARLT
jgi:hypothetical protein